MKRALGFVLVSWPAVAAIAAICYLSDPWWEVPAILGGIAFVVSSVATGMYLLAPE